MASTTTIFPIVPTSTLTQEMPSIIVPISTPTPTIAIAPIIPISTPTPKTPSTSTSIPVRIFNF